MSSSDTIQVSETSAQASARVEREKRGTPSHWVNATPTQFQNPWPSWRKGWTDAWDVLEMVTLGPKTMFAPPVADVAQIPIQAPTWGADADARKIKATWLGHACFLVELPSATAGLRGARILFDPVFSDRCSPTQWIGPKRFTPPPCALHDIPAIDAIVISHNHYDHMDTASLTALLARTPAPPVFAPLGNVPYLTSLLPHRPKSAPPQVQTLDWWDARRVAPPGGVAPFDVTLTPAQHFTGRGLHDRFRTLWGAWVVEGVVPRASEGEGVGARVYFGGDTGYRAVPSSSDEGPDTLPVCPAFKEVGARFGGFDLALIPIGAYAPRRPMSNIHCAPRDSVAIFQDIRARRALGMHWGTWTLTTEPVLAPPAELAAACAAARVPPGAFGVCAIGETVLVDVGAGGGDA